MKTLNAREIRNLKQQIKAAAARSDLVWLDKLQRELAKGMANNRAKRAAK